MQSRFAPIAYFAFNRPEHAKRSLAALAANPEAASTDLHIFVDGPRNDQDAGLVAEVERIARGTRGFRSVETVASGRNQGLYTAITRGVSHVIAEAGRAIVVEDDIVVSPHFLRYMNDGLDRYREEPRVGSIHAYSPPIPGLPDFFFLRGGDCWGWATWSDRWRLFDGDAGRLLSRMARERRLGEFSRVQGHRSLLMLAQRALGRNRSWALPWHASLFLEDRFTLQPGRSFVRNIGNDGSGEHSAVSSVFDTDIRNAYATLPPLIPDADADTTRAIGGYYDSFGQSGPVALAKRTGLRLYALLLALYAAARWRRSMGVQGT